MSSEQRFKINLRLPWRFAQFGKELKGMNDCVIQIGETKIPSNILLLAKNSQWFDDYFVKNMEPGVQYGDENPLVVPINDIELKHMQSFLDILYKNYLQINVYNLPHLLRIAHFYKFPHITNILRAFYKDASRSDLTLMYFTKTFIQNGLVEDAIALAPEITSHFMRAEENDTTEMITIKEIYDATSPPVFAAVLIERRKRLEAKSNMQSNAPDAEPVQRNTTVHVNKSIRENMKQFILHKEPTGDRLLIKYIEEFVKVKGAKNLTENDKESLAEVFVSSMNNSGLMSVIFTESVINNDCDWMPSRFLKFHIKRILDSKRRAMRQFERTVNKLGKDDTINRWYITSRVRNIKNAVANPDVVPLIEFIRTLGGVINPIDPVEYGFITINSSKEMINKRDARNVFIQDPSCYFISRKYDDKNGFIEFNLGDDVLFRPSHLYLDSRANYKEQELNNSTGSEQNVAKLDYRSHIFKSILTLCPKIGDEKPVEFNLPKAEETQMIGFPRQRPFSAAKFEVAETDKKESTIFRITTLEVMGDFVLK